MAMTEREFQQVGEIEMDGRRRASFGKIGRHEHRRYLVEEADNGELHLIPLVSMPITTTKEEFEARMAQALEQARDGKTRDLGSFAQYADDEDESDEE